MTEGGHRRRYGTDLAGGLVETEVMPELFLAYSTRSINLVAEDKERNLGELLNGKERVEFGLRLGETLHIDTVDEEDDAIDLGEVVTPEATRCQDVRGRPRAELGFDTHPADVLPSRMS